MRSKRVVLPLVAFAYAAGVFTSQLIPRVEAQQKASRFESLGTDGPFRLWRDTKTDQCFIVTTPYFAMLALASC